MPERALSGAQVMAAHVARSARSLNDGAVVVTVLEDLWRAAYAMGVRGEMQRHREQATGLRDRLQAEPAARLARRYEQRAAQDAGWRFGPAVTVLTGVTEFRFGGTDPVKPNCDRLAVWDGRVIAFQDTGERVTLVSSFWASTDPGGHEADRG